jgi:hypothetical protein
LTIPYGAPFRPKVFENQNSSRESAESIREFTSVRNFTAIRDFTTNRDFTVTIRDFTVIRDFTAIYSRFYK